MLCCRYSAGPETALKGRLGAPRTSEGQPGQVRNSRRGIIVPGGNGGLRTRRQREFLTKQAAALWPRTPRTDLTSSSTPPTGALPGTDRRWPRPHSASPRVRPHRGHAHLGWKRSLDSKFSFLPQGGRNTTLKLPSFLFLELDRNQR